ncbi:hypothetical protein SerAS12_1901 [Serratia sp. AS12]|nr:hypothetical protein SerAS9_1901 [Serratia plymuthica AS9]AEF49980.1 hypothetical protein SerAS12_1901 [Serratia sp. AS12]AEG27688.1 hypothetical protein SerAS13_1902 [Serratia sp. AS13]
MVIFILSIMSGESMQALQFHQLAAALEFSVLGKITDEFELGHIAHEFKSKNLSNESFIKRVLNSESGVSLYQDKKEDEIIISVYENIYKVTPAVESLNHYLNLQSKEGTKATIEYKVNELFNDLFNYQGFDPSKIKSQNNFIDTIDKTYKDQEVIDISISDQNLLAMAYISILGRGVDAQGFNAYLGSLKSNAHGIDYILNDIILSKEAAHSAGSLYGVEFLNYIFNKFINRDATAQELSLLNSNSRVESLKNAIDYVMTEKNVTLKETGFLTQNVGDSLVFDKNVIAEIQSDGRLLSSANTGKAHILSAIEMTSMVNLTIHSEGKSKIDLSQAKNLSTVKIVGSQDVELVLYPSINPVVIDSSNYFEGTDGNDIKILTDVTDTTHEWLDLKAGDDSLLWFGPVDDIHQPSKFIIADGGDGIDKLSANFFIKPQPSDNPYAKSPNSDNFKNFEKIDFGGYAGEFNFYWTDIKNGFSLSKKAENVVVEKINKESSLSLDITGNATSQSNIKFIIDGIQNDSMGRKSNFEIHFNSKSAGSIDGGTITLESTQISDLPGYKSLSSITINSDGLIGNVNKIKIENSSLASGNEGGDSKINILGNNKLELTLSDVSLGKVGMNKVIDASENSGGLTLHSDYWVNEGLKLRWLGSDLKDASGYDVNTYITDGHYTPTPLNVIGTNNNDLFYVASGTMISSGSGDDLINMNSASNGYVRVTDFDLNHDALQFDDTVNLSKDESTPVSDYGIHTFDEIGSSWIEVFVNNDFSNDRIISSIISLAGPLDAVGVLSLKGQDGKVNSFVINDVNKNHVFDAKDSYFMLDNQNHQELIQGLKYDSVIEINGVSASLG